MCQPGNQTLLQCQAHLDTAGFQLGGQVNDKYTHVTAIVGEVFQEGGDS